MKSDVNQKEFKKYVQLVLIEPKVNRNASSFNSEEG